MTVPRTDTTAFPLSYFPGLGFCVTMAAILITAVLFLLGLVMGADGNITQLAYDSQGEVIYRLMLKPGITEDAAQQLVKKLTSSGRWIKGEVVPASQGFFEVQELKNWAAEKENVDLVKSLPFSIDLYPARILSPSVDPSLLFRSLNDNEEIDQVFYDREGVRWLRQMFLTSKSLCFSLEIALGILGFGFAVVIGIMLEKILKAREGIYHEKELRLHKCRWLRFAACSSGLFALIGLWLLYAGISFGQGVPIDFLSIASSLSLVAGGIILGAVIMMAPGLARIPGLRKLLPILFLLLTIATSHASNLPSAPATAKERPAIASAAPAMPREEGYVTSLPLPSTATAQERKELESRYTQRIGEIEQLTNFLDQWLARSAEERKLDQKNYDLQKMKVSLAANEEDFDSDNLERRTAETKQLAFALVHMRPTTLQVFGGGQARMKRDYAAAVLADSTHQTLFMHELDRKKIVESKTRLEQARREEFRLAYFARYADQSPDLVRQEKMRLERERIDLTQKKSALNATPANLVQTQIADAKPTPPPEPVLETRTPEPVLQTELNSVVVPVESLNRPEKMYTGTRTKIDFGLDLPLPANSQIHAVRAGKVLYASNFKGMGLTVIVEHDQGLSTVYSFLSAIGVKSGQSLKAGDLIGASGNIKRLDQNGVRFEVRQFGKLSPLRILPGLSGQNLESRLLGTG